MTGPAYVIEHRYMALAEKAQTVGLTWVEKMLLTWCQERMRDAHAQWFAPSVHPAETLRAAS